MLTVNKRLKRSFKVRVEGMGRCSCRGLEQSWSYGLRGEVPEYKITLRTCLELSVHYFTARAPDAQGELRAVYYRLLWSSSFGSKLSPRYSQSLC